MLCRQYGPFAWLVEDISDPIGWALGLEQMAHVAVKEIVPAAETVLVIAERRAHDEVGRLLHDVTTISTQNEIADVVIDVLYDGADLAEVAQRTDLSIDGVVELHSNAKYTVQFCGFSPGFAYLGGLDPSLQLPRRESPRTRVPPGSVAIAANYSCVYPSESPGGWHLLGTTAADVWNVERPQPALLMPGTQVRFHPVQS
jgi:KipI family sensor histidine kinase inhibitor